MKSWKKKWKAELNEATPKLRQDVANQPINVVATQNNAPSQTFAVRRKPFWFGLSSAVAAVLIVVVLCVSLIPSGGGNVYAFVVEINPAITISADNNGNVTGIVASNADADVVLSDYETVNGLKGKPVDEVIKWYVDRAAKLGYLDEDAPSAVRISTADNGSKLLGKVTDSLESYFMERGVTSFVVADVVDLSALAERANLSVNNNINAIADCVQGLEPIYRNRGVDNLSADELKQTYKSYLSADAFVNGVGDYLNGIIDIIEQNELAVAELSALNDEIEAHPDNRALIKNYWGVKAFLKYFDYGQDFENLVKTMDEKLADYNATYGNDITDVVGLYSAVSMYKIISAGELRTILNHFTADFLMLRLDWLSDIIQTVSADTPLIGLTTLPETTVEFINKVQDVVTIESASREKQFEDIYNKHREQISKEDYRQFKQELLARYGSTDELWNNLK